MRHEETTFTKVRYSGKLGPTIGDRTANASYNLEIVGGMAFISLLSDQLHSTIVVRSLPHLLNFYRDLGAILNDLQPGLTLPLPEGDPDYIEALKVIHEADRLNLEGK